MIEMAPPTKNDASITRGVERKVRSVSTGSWNGYEQKPCKDRRAEGRWEKVGDGERRRARGREGRFERRGLEPRLQERRAERRG